MFDVGEKRGTRGLEHLVGNRTISEIESNQSGNCVIARVPEGESDGTVLRTNIHGIRRKAPSGVSSSSCSPRPSSYMTEPETESTLNSVCIRSVSTGQTRLEFAASQRWHCRIETTSNIVFPGETVAIIRDHRANFSANEPLKSDAVCLGLC